MLIYNSQGLAIEVHFINNDSPDSRSETEPIASSQLQRYVQNHYKTELEKNSIIEKPYEEDREVELSP